MINPKGLFLVYIGGGGPPLPFPSGAIMQKTEVFLPGLLSPSSLSHRFDQTQLQRVRGIYKAEATKSAPYARVEVPS
jgi:hypothetical protein